MAAINKKNLVIVRAGDYSLHEEWLDNQHNAGARNWDIIVSCFGENPEKWQRDDVIHIFDKGGKFDGLYDAFQQVPGLLDKYDYIMMADDDFIMTADDINRTFDIMREYDLQIGQPTLTHDSFAMYFPEYHNPSFKIRFSNFTEAITLCISSNIWRQILPLYEDNPMALFIDNFWARLADDPARQIAFIDDVQITHARPCKEGDLWGNWGHFFEEGPVQYTIPDHTPNRDKWYLPKIVCHAGILKNGRHVRSRWAMLPHLILGWIKAAKNIDRSQIVENRSPQRCLKRSVQNQITGRRTQKKTHIIIHGR